MRAKQLLLRRNELTEVFSSVNVARRAIQHKLLIPVIKEHRLALFAYDDCIRLVARLKGGQKLPPLVRSKGKKA
jgi:hypothetical protein